MICKLNFPFIYMKIRTALTLKYTCVTATIFLLCTVLIYLVSEHTRDQTFFRNLKSEGITKANLFLAGQVDARTMQSVYLNNRKFINEVEVAVYTTDFQSLLKKSRSMSSMPPHISSWHCVPCLSYYRWFGVLHPSHL